LKDQENNQERNLPEQQEKKQMLRLKGGVTRLRQKQEEKRIERDAVFEEPLTPAPAADETAPLSRGSVDMWFLLWAMLLVCFGAVMSYSASAVYAQREYDSSTYYLWRYILFAVVATVVTVLFVIYARPWFWRMFGVGAYAVSIFLLLIDTA